MNFKKITLLAALLCAMALGANAQTALTQTRLSTAVATSSTTTVVVVSATNITAGTLIYVEDGTGYQGEAMFVNAVSGTTLSVTRGYNSTAGAPHIANAVVLAGPPNAFNVTDPTGGAPGGSCGNVLYTPWINIRTGSQWLCSTVTSSWVPGFFNIEAPAGVSAAVASVAGATLPSGPLFHVTGTNAITAWGSSTTVGAIGAGGSTSDAVGAPFCVIPDAIFTTTATNNIALASTAVVNKILCFTFDQTNKKYVPTY